MATFTPYSKVSEGRLQVDVNNTSTGAPGREVTGAADGVPRSVDNFWTIPCQPDAYKYIEPSKPGVERQIA